MITQHEAIRWARAEAERLVQAYGEALANSVLNQQDVKNVIAWAGLRNQAAHGEFEDLTRANAGLMAQGVNLFIQQKAR